MAALRGLSITVGFTEDSVSLLVYQDDEKGNGKKKGGVERKFGDKDKVSGEFFMNSKPLFCRLKFAAVS